MFVIKYRIFALKFTGKYSIISLYIEFCTTGCAKERIIFMQMEWNYVGTVVVSGLVIVFLSLLLLILFVLIFGGIFKQLGSRKKASPNNAVRSEALPAAERADQPAADIDDSDEIAAVIAAAVAAIGSAEGRQLVVRSVRRTSSRSGKGSWAAAAVAENTRSFR